MDETIDISIIIPCHNLEDYIKPMLLSLQALNLKDITAEVIFVLDDCTDRTEDVIRKYAHEFPYKIIHCNVHSCGLARNEGLEIARGTYVWFVDGDDWIIYPDVLQNALPLLNKSGEEVIQLKFISNFFKMEHFAMVWQYIYRRSAIGDLRFTEIQPHEDRDFNKEFFTQHNLTDIYFFEIPTYFYNYKRPGSNTHQLMTTGEIKP